MKGPQSLLPSLLIYLSSLPPPHHKDAAKRLQASVPALARLHGIDGQARQPQR